METRQVVSIIVPVYNMERWLHRCVDSLLRQTYPNLDIVLIDDGSKDQSSAICDAYAARDPRIHVKHKPNGGVAAAMNDGIDAAQGEYLLFVDSDDYIAEDMVEVLLQASLQNNADITQCGMINVDDQAREISREAIPDAVIDKNESIMDTFFLQNRITLSLACKLYRRELFSAFRLDARRNIADILATPQLLLQCQRYVILSGAFYYAYIRADSVSRGEMSDREFDDILSYLAYWEHLVDTYRPRHEAWEQRVVFRYVYEMMECYWKLKRSAKLTQKEEKLKQVRSLFQENYKKLKKGEAANHATRNQRVLFRVFSASPAIYRFLLKLIQLRSRLRTKMRGVTS